MGLQLPAPGRLLLAQPELVAVFLVVEDPGRSALEGGARRGPVGGAAGGGCGGRVRDGRGTLQQVLAVQGGAGRERGAAGPALPLSRPGSSTTRNTATSSGCARRSQNLLQCSS